MFTEVAVSKRSKRAAAIKEKCIQSAQLIKKMSIPQCIIQKIAESATGFVKDCQNKKCSNCVIHLLEDFECNTGVGGFLSI